MLSRRSGRPLNKFDSFPVYYDCPAQRIHTNVGLKLLREPARDGSQMSISGFLLIEK